MPRRPRHNLDASAKERADSRRTAKARTDYQLATRKAWDHKAAIAFGRRLLGRRGCALSERGARTERQRSHVRIVSGAPGKAASERAGTVAGKKSVLGSIVSRAPDGDHEAF